MFELVTDLGYLSEDFTPKENSWWCLHCVATKNAPMGWSGEGGVRSHVNSSHHISYDDMSVGEDYATTEGLIACLDRWRLENRRALRAFSLELESIFTVDDFLFEAGA